MRKLIIFIVFIFFSSSLVGCNLFSKKETITSIEVVGAEVQFDENFKLSDINIKVNKYDGSSTLIPLTEAMLNDEDLLKFNEAGLHTISVNYENLSTSFQITIKGEKGDDGREIELDVVEDYICWRYLGDNTWNNLVPLSLLVGDTGDNGKEVTLDLIDGFIKWKYVDDDNWNSLISVDLLKGEDGIDGKEVTFQVANNYIEWKYVGESVWNKLLSLDSIKGENGVTPSIEISADGYWVINGVKTTYKAVYEIIDTKCRVTFDVNLGTMPEGSDMVVDVNKGDSITLPIPTRNMYLFKGWFTGDTVNDIQFSNYTAVTKDVSLYARWEEAPNVLEDFLNLVNSSNYTALIENTTETIVGSKYSRFDQRITEKAFEQYNIINQFHQIDEKYYNGDVLENENNYQEYNVYEAGVIYNLRNELIGRLQSKIQI